MRNVTCKSCRFIMVFLALFVSIAMADALVENESTYTNHPVKKRRGYILPYAFSSETFETAVGIGGIAGGILGQRQCNVAATILGSSNGSALGALRIGNYQLPFAPRIFMDLFALGARYDALRVYAGKNPDFPDERPGTNNSDPLNFNRQHAWEANVELPIRCLLPLGAGKDEAMHTYHLRNGILTGGATDAKGWDPMDGGRTFLTLTPNYRHQYTDLDDREIHAQTLNLELSLEYDNRDFYMNPTRGSYQSISCTYDPAWIEYDNSWYFVDLDLRKYISLTDILPFRQAVLALNFWTADVPTWENAEEAGEDVVYHRPPYFTGATLGGLYRMRGYPSSRFSGKSAVYYGGEVRVIPNWNPFPKIPIINRFDVPWWQWALIGEVGRVADHYNLGTLHTDMKWDAGVSFRAMVETSVVRLDFVSSPESSSIVAMVGHPF